MLLKEKLRKIGTYSLLSVGCLVQGIGHAADPANGGTLFSQHCVSCHGESGAGGVPGVPDFTRGNLTFLPDSDLATSIRDGKQVMPGFRGILSDSDINDVIAYLRTLR